MGFLYLWRLGATLHLWCVGFSLQWLLLLQTSGSRARGLSSCGSRALEHRLSSCGTRPYSCSMACGIFPEQESSPWPLHWQADSQPLDHQGSPISGLFNDGHPDWCEVVPFCTSFFEIQTILFNTLKIHFKFITHATWMILKLYFLPRYMLCIAKWKIYLKRGAFTQTDCPSDCWNKLEESNE